METELDELEFQFWGLLEITSYFLSKANCQFGFLKRNGQYAVYKRHILNRRPFTRDLVYLWGHRKMEKEEDKNDTPYKH